MIHYTNLENQDIILDLETHNLIKIKFPSV